MKVKKIMKRIIHEKDVIELSKESPFKHYRFKAKAVNFGFIFGRSSYGFKPELEESWSDEEIDNYIKENKLQITKDKYDKNDTYLTVSEEFRKRYFEKYPKLMTWIKNCHKIVKQGYVESPQGARRHLPYMRYEGKNSDKMVYSNLKNISVNSPVQGMEACLIYEAMIKIDEEMVEKNMKSLPINSVYDSLVFYVHKDELKDMALLCKKHMEIKDRWDIPILVDVEVGRVWGFGYEINFDDIDNSIIEIEKKLEKSKS